MRLFRSIICLLCICPMMLCAQEEDSGQETLFSGDVEHGGYGGFVLKGSTVRGTPQLFLGGYGGWFINRTIMIGGGGYGMVSRVSASDAVPKLDGKTPEIGLGYGGFVVEYTHNSNSLVHFTGQALIGAGGAGYIWRDQLFDTEYDFNDTPSDSFFTVEFGANVELNVSSFARVAIGGSYRFVSGLDLVGLSDKDLSGPGGNITFKFGKF